MNITTPPAALAEVPLPANYISRKFGLSRTTLWRWRKLGLPVQQVFGKQFILESDVVAFIAKMNAAGKTPAPPTT